MPTALSTRAFRISQISLCTPSASAAGLRLKAAGGGEEAAAGIAGVASSAAAAHAGALSTIISAAAAAAAGVEGAPTAAAAIEIAAAEEKLHPGSQLPNPEMEEVEMGPAAAGDGGWGVEGAAGKGMGGGLSIQCAAL